VTQEQETLCSQLLALLSLPADELLAKYKQSPPELRKLIRWAVQNGEAQIDPLLWMQRHTKTRDDHWQDKGTEPFAHFPQKPYFPFLFYILQKFKRVFIPKSREMMISWVVMGWVAHQCQWNPNTLAIVQSAKHDKSKDLVSGEGRPGYVRTLWEQQDEFLRILHPLQKDSADMPADRFTWANGSQVMAFPAGAEQIRQYHPQIFVMDEAAFLPEAEESWDAAHPVTGQIIAVSSAGPSWFGDMVQHIGEVGGCPPGVERRKS
jgi:hypothetical protein